MTTGRSDRRRPPTVREKQILRVGWLIDGRGGPPAIDQVIVIDQGRIESIRSYPGLSVPHAGIEDLSGVTILPALMDAHVHLAFSGTLDAGLRQAQLNHTPRQSEEAIKAHLRDHLDNGIVAVRDGGDKLGQVLKVKFGQKTLVHLAATCRAWHAPGRYGAMIGLAPAPGESLPQAVARSAQGMDHIKLIQSGINSLDQFGLQTAPQFPQAELALVRQFALSHGLPMMVHANGKDAVQSALSAGCDSIEHGYFMGPDNLRRMADRQVYWVPTAIPMAALTRKGVLPQLRTDVARRTLEHQLKQIAAAHQYGVRIALGTDAGSMGADHGTAVRQELALLMDAGLSLPQAVKCATFNTAQLLGLDDRGSLQSGCRADFITVHGSPEHLPASLENISGLCVLGQWLKRSL
jgi:imidazolonepropionase-like amidohydrolase